MEDRCPLCPEGVLPEEVQKKHFMLHIHGVIDRKGKFRWEYLRGIRDPHSDNLIHDWILINSIKRGDMIYRQPFLQQIAQAFAAFAHI